MTRRLQREAKARAALEAAEAAAMLGGGQGGAAEGVLVGTGRTVGTDTELDALLENGVGFVQRSGGKQRRTTRRRRQEVGMAVKRAVLWLADEGSLDGGAVLVAQAALAEQFGGAGWRARVENNLDVARARWQGGGE